MAPGDERIARNQALFREVNERIKEINTVLATEEEADFLCECGDDGCTQPISLTLTEYEEVRSDPTQFAVAPGHVLTEVEHVVSKNDRFFLVRKTKPNAVEVAVDEDPRS